MKTVLAGKTSSLILDRFECGFDLSFTLFDLCLVSDDIRLCGIYLELIAVDLAVLFRNEGFLIGFLKLCICLGFVEDLLLKIELLLAEGNIFYIGLVFFPEASVCLYDSFDVFRGVQKVIEARC